MKWLWKYQVIIPTKEVNFLLKFLYPRVNRTTGTTRPSGFGAKLAPYTMLQENVNDHFVSCPKVGTYAVSSGCLEEKSVYCIHWMSEGISLRFLGHFMQRHMVLW